VFDLYTLYHLILVSAHNGDEPPKDISDTFMYSRQSREYKT